MPKIGLLIGYLSKFSKNMKSKWQEYFKAEEIQNVEDKFTKKYRAI